MVHAALKLIKEFGPAGFTFAEVTRVVGVSPAAPYRHFRDRDALMAFIAQRGFGLFSKKLLKAWDEGRPDPLIAYKNVGVAYLAFAKSEPAYYAAMFDTHFSEDMMRDVKKASDEAFNVMRQATESLLEKLPESKRPPSLMMALHMWSMAHGIVALYGVGQNSRHTIPMEPEDLLEAGSLIYLEGLGLA